VPTTIVQGFQTLRSNLEITDLQASTASTRQQTIREAVEAELTVLDSFTTGSYRRNTMIAPLKEADIDIVVVLSSSYYSANGQASLLEKVRQVLRKRYPNTPRVSRNGQAVTVTFDDFQVDVVPAFNRQGGGYLIPDTTKGRWISTDPKKHVAIWSESNAVHNGDLVPLIKMLKAWNKSHSQLLRSFHLETIVLRVLNNIRITDFPSGARYVFDKARAQIRLPQPDLAGYTGDVGDYLDTDQKMKEVEDRLGKAFAQAVYAEQLAARNDVRSAFDQWRTVFGDYFPAFG